MLDGSVRCYIHSVTILSTQTPHNYLHCWTTHNFTIHILQFTYITVYKQDWKPPPVYEYLPKLFKLSESCLKFNHFVQILVGIILKQGKENTKIHIMKSM